MTAPADQPGTTTLLVSLPTEAITALQTASRLCHHNQAQVIYHGLRWWARILYHQAHGGQIYLRNPDGDLHQVLFAAGSFGPDTCEHERPCRPSPDTGPGPVARHALPGPAP